MGTANSRGKTVRNRREKTGKSSELLYGVLKKKLIMLEYKPGQLLDEKELMEELGVGRTPLRECMLRLKAEGLVVGEPNRPNYVKDISLRGTKDVIEALLLMEKSIASLAASRITEEQIAQLRVVHEQISEAMKAEDDWQVTSLNEDFHRLICEATNNAFLIELHQIIRSQVQRLSYLSVMQHFGGGGVVYGKEKIIDQHGRIIECFAKRDQKAAEEIMVQHIDLFRNRIAHYLAGPDS